MIYELFCLFFIFSSLPPLFSLPHKLRNFLSFEQKEPFQILTFAQKNYTGLGLVLHDVIRIFANPNGLSDQPLQIST